MAGTIWARDTSSCKNLSLGEPKTIKLTPLSESSDSSSLLLVVREEQSQPKTAWNKKGGGVN